MVLLTQITATLTADAKAELNAFDGLGFDGYDHRRAARTVDDPYVPSEKGNHISECG